jgi:hypothetical protein
LLNAVIRCSQLNTQGVLERLPVSGLLVIDAVGLWSMYFVVMPRVNIIAGWPAQTARLAMRLFEFSCIMYMEISSSKSVKYF